MILELVPQPKMVGKGPFPRMVGRELSPNLATMISEPIGTEQNPQAEDRTSSIKTDQGLHLEIGLFPQ